MDSQPPPPPAPAAATYARHHDYDHHHGYHRDYQHGAHGSPHYSYSYSEKDAYPPEPQHPQHGYDPSPFAAGAHHLPPPSPSSSVSSAGRKHRSHEIQHAPPLNPAYPARAHVDPEKAAYSPRRDANVTTVPYDSSDYPDKGPEEKPVQLLLFLSGPCVLLSILIALWTFLSLLVSLALAPVRLCSAARPSLSSQLTTFLAPPLNLQLQLIYSFSSVTEYSVPMLVIVHLFSPIVSLGVAIGAWTAACFWFFSAILGDPVGPGQDQGHNDGKDSLLGVRRWWDRWLSRGLRGA